MSECSGILIYLESRGGLPAPAGLELAGEAVRLAKAGGGRIYGVAVTDEPERLRRELRDCPLEALYIYHTVEEFQAGVYEAAVNDCINAVKPAIVLIGGTVQGRALAPRIAVAFRTGLTADCTELQIDEAGRLVQIRPAFGGNIMAAILTEQARPQIATVRPGMFQPAAGIRNGNLTVIEQPLPGYGRRAETLEQSRPEPKPGIDRQDLLVVAGRGIRKKEDLDLLRELAERLGGKLASSRALVEKGWMRPEEQIGLSGTTVTPKCMLLFGVSGSVQFMAGMKNTPYIVAVNSDPQAKIFEIAHVPICADLYEVVPELLSELKKQDEG